MGRVTSAVFASVVLLGVAWLILRDDVAPESTETPQIGEAGEPILKTKGVAKKPTPDVAPADGSALRAGFASKDPQDQIQAYEVAAKAERITFDEDLVKLMVAWFQTENRVLVHRAGVVLTRIGPRALPFTQPLLSSESGEARWHALWLFRKWKLAGFDDVVYPPLLPFLEDGHYSVRQVARSLVLSGASYDAEVADFFKDQIRPSPGAEYYGPEVVLANMGDEGFAYVLSLIDDPKLLYNGLGGLRGAPLEMLREVMPRLAAFIRNEDDEDAQIGAIRLLLRFDGDCEAMLPALDQALLGESYAVRNEVLMVLEVMGKRAAPAIEGVLAALEDRDERIVARAASVLAELKGAPERVLPALRRAMDGDGGDAAASALGSFGEAALPYLVDALDQGDEDVRYFALYGVAALGPQAEPLVERVITLLDIDDFELQVRAAATLGKLGPAGAPGIPHILALLHDETLTPGSTAGILMGIGKPTEVALITELRKQDAPGQLRVLEVLSAFHGRSAFALEALRPFLGHADVRVRRMALQAVIVSTWKDRWTHGAWSKSDPAVRTRVRELIAGLVGDPDPALRKSAERALANLNAVER